MVAEKGPNALVRRVRRVREYSRCLYWNTDWKNENGTNRSALHRIADGNLFIRQVWAELWLRIQVAMRILR